MALESLLVQFWATQDRSDQDRSSLAAQSRSSVSVCADTASVLDWYVLTEKLRGSHEPTVLTSTTAHLGPIRSLMGLHHVLILDSVTGPV